MTVRADANPTYVILSQASEMDDVLNVNTKRAYYRAIRDFAEYLDEVEITRFDGLTYVTIENFLARYGNKVSSRNQALSAIRYILERCIDAGYEIENFSRIKQKLKHKKTSRAKKLFLSKNQLLQARENAYSLFERRDLRIRNLLIYDLAMHTMMRCDELAQIRLIDVDVVQKSLNVRGKGGAGDRHGRRAVTDSIPLTEDLVRQIVHYTDKWRFVCKDEDTRPRFNVPGTIRPEAPLFTSQKRTGISSSCISRVISTIICSLFEDKGAIPANHAVHCIRRSMATHKMKSGVDLPTIQRMLRHESIETTINYLQIDRQMMEKAFLQD